LTLRWRQNDDAANAVHGHHGHGNPAGSGHVACRSWRRGVGLLTIDGAIGPASADYVVHGIARSASAGHQLVILRMDTPGGLDTAMREMIKAILTSPVPVATYVAPRAARAPPAPAPTSCTPATSRPWRPAPTSARPRRSRSASDSRSPNRTRKSRTRRPAGSPMARKQVNDAAAYLRGLAQMRGRNADWAERAVRECRQPDRRRSPEAARHRGRRPDVPGLLAQLDGKTVTVLGQARRLETKGVAPVEFSPDWRTRLLAAITHPSVALLLMTIGIYGLVFEFMSPGYVAPGVIGTICLLLGLYACNCCR
jgi:membrane-bound serine protease (ClpP class)